MTTVPAGARLGRAMPDRAMAERVLFTNSSKRLAFPYIKDQAPSGVEVSCCVSAAIASCMEFIASSGAGREFSMLYHYFFSKGRGRNGGMTIEEGIQITKVFGICDLRLHAYPVEPRYAGRNPSGSAFADGKMRRVERAEIVAGKGSREAWMRLLDAGYPLVLIFHLYSALYARIPHNGNTHPEPVGMPDNAHAVVVVGYDRVRACFIIQDSKGAQWGAMGTWLLPFHLAESAAFTYAISYITQTSRGVLK